MIKIDNLQFSYPKQTQLFDHLNLQLEVGKIYGLLGKNGTGKSTLLMLIHGLIFPQNGIISVNGHTPLKRQTVFLQEIYFIPESYQLPAISIQQYAQTYGKFYPKFDLPKYKSLIQQFGLNITNQLSDLSFGNKKKIRIAFALSSNCKYILMDEPTNGLDIPSKAQLRKLIAKEIKSDQFLIISTHQIRDLAQLMESVIVLNEGKIVLAKDMFELEENLMFHYDTNAKIEGSIYTEKIMGQYLHILPNPNKLASEINLETLFNGLLSHADAITKQFN